MQVVFPNDFQVSENKTFSVKTWKSEKIEGFRILAGASVYGADGVNTFAMIDENNRLNVPGQTIDSINKYLKKLKK